MGCICTKAAAPPPAQSGTGDAYVNEDARDSAPLLDAPAETAERTATVEESSSSSVNQEMIQRLLDEISASSDE